MEHHFSPLYTLIPRGSAILGLVGSKLGGSYEKIP